MQNNRAKVTGVVLAGGQARRMGNRDKGLIQYLGRPLIHCAIDALSPVVGKIIINANRNQDIYSRLGHRVISDLTDTYDGPLAGILSSLKRIDTPYLLSIPCDCPLIESKLLTQMVDDFLRNQADAGVAFDGKRIHPVFLILKTELAESLEIYLASGQRKIDTWLFQHKLEKFDFSEFPEMFENVNTPEDLACLESRIKAKLSEDGNKGE